MTSTPTPRTNAALVTFPVAEVLIGGAQPTRYVPADFAREMERENARLRAALEHFRKPITEIGGAGMAYTIMTSGQKNLNAALAAYCAKKASP